MKKLLLSLMLLLVVTLSQAQTNCYGSIGLSIPNTNDLKNNAYPSVELGITHNNVSLGFNVGRNNFNFDTNQPYFLELKTTASTQLGFCKGFVLLGTGMYFGESNMFIEYGGGLIYSLNNRFDFSVQVSNWNTVTYLSPGLTYNFKL